MQYKVLYFNDTQRLCIPGLGAEYLKEEFFYTFGEDYQLFPESNLFFNDINLLFLKLENTKQ